MIVAACVVTLLACGTRGGSSAAADEPEVKVLGDDTFMAGRELHLDREAPGDAVLAGGTIEVVAPVAGDGVFAGRQLELAGPFRQDVYAAGGRIRVTGDIAGSSRLAGGDVILAPESHVGGGLSIAAGRAQIDGDVGGYLQVMAGSTRLGGHVSGDVQVNGELELAPSAVIDGSLLVRSAEPAAIAPGAVVRGELRHIPAQDTGRGRWVAAAVFSLIAAVGLALAAGVLWSVWPAFTRSVEAVVRQRPSAALIAGVGVLFGAPILIVMLFFSLIGIPLALLASLLYLMSLPLGYLAASAGIADALLERARRGASAPWLKRVLTLMLVLLGLSLIGFIPIVGGLALLVLTLIGMGALVPASIAAHRGRRAGAAAPAPAAHTTRSPSHTITSSRRAKCMSGGGPATSSP
jgi:hypothetical protein